ncbi:hypothetical protein LTS18_004974, partial [Coniosporium uncinatum]
TSNQPPKALTATELVEHPEFPHVIWDLKPEKKGTVAVAKDRRGPVNIAYEVHGHGPIHLVWIMGLGSLKTQWQRQTKDFGHKQADKYTCLVFDNRGVGESDKPIQRYSTFEMAKDCVELLDHLGWDQKRSLHVTGISMGGMIAQELGLLIPERICSLNLISTAARLVRTIGFVENIRNRVMLLVPHSEDTQLANIKHNIYTERFLNAPDSLGPESIAKPFPTNGDRAAATEIWKRRNPQLFTRPGFLAQAIAAGWHHKSDTQLKELADKVGAKRILVVHGEEDRMITFPHASVLLEGLGGEEAGVRKEFVEEMGHVVPIEMREEFGRWIEEVVERTERMGGN